MASGWVRGNLRRWWPALALGIVVLIAELLVLNFTVLNQPNENNTGQHSSDNHQECSDGESLALAIDTAQRVACVFVFKNLRFVDRYHDTLNAGSTLAVAIFTATLWSTTRKLWEAGEKQIGLLEADQARRLTEIETSLKLATDNAIASKQAADAASGSLELTRKTFIATQRPRLKVSNIWIISPGEDKLWFGKAMGIVGAVDCENIGGTVAYVKDGDVLILCRKGGLPRQYPMGSRRLPTKKASVRPITDGVDLQPGDVDAFPIGAPGDFTFSEEQAESINTGTGAYNLYVLGWVDYADDLGFMRRMKFCRRYDYATGRFQPVGDPDYENEG